jgi:CelD/BcsL family acetyltransferase involved in cellulose biosynthesis
MQEVSEASGSVQAVAAGRAHLHAEVHRGLAGLERVREEWADLARGDSRAHYYHYPGWLLASLEHLYTATGDPWLFLFRDEAGQLRALIPLVRQAGGEWRAPRNDQTSYVDLVAADDAMAREALRLLPRVVGRHGGGRLVFDRVLAGSNLLVPGGGARVESLPDKRSDWVDLEGGSEAVFAHLGRHFRKELRRKRRRAEEHGPLAFRASLAGSATAAEREEAFADFLRLEAGGWKGAHGTGTAIALHPELRAFYARLLDEFTTEPRWRIHRLFLGEECVAAQLAVECSGTVYLLKIAFDEAYAGASPGLLAVASLIEALDAEPAVQRLTFVTGNRYQDVWRPRQRAVYRVTLYTPGLSGRVAWATDGARSGLRRLRAVLAGLRHLRGGNTKEKGAGH